MEKQNINTKLLAVLLLLLCEAPTIYTYFTIDDCINVAKSNCQCSEKNYTYEIQCPVYATKPQFKLRLSQIGSSMANIKCDDIDAGEFYKLVPLMQIGAIYFLTIKNCPIFDMIVSLAIEHLGISDVNILYIHDADSAATLTRKQFHSLGSLRRLDLICSGILNVNLFSGLKNLTVLNLQTTIIKLPNAIFNPLENLKVLYFASDYLQQLPAEIFCKQRNLKRLHLHVNHLRRLNKETFIGASSMMELILSINGVHSFEPNVFSLLTNLTTITLNKNNIRALPSQLFANNKNLSVVHIIDNQTPLATLPPGLLSNLSHLQEVHITCNAIRLTDDIFTNPKDLKYLQLSKYNQLQSATEDLPDLPSGLVRISCGLNTVPGDLFENSKKIAGISLANNKLFTLPANLFTKQNLLQHVDLSYNRLQSLPDDLFHDTINLSVLILSHNQLTRISDEVLYSLYNLKILNLDNNHLITINPTASISNWKVEINTDTQNDTLPSQKYQYFQKLEVLNLSNNKLQYFPNRLRCEMSRLREINLSNNKITTLNYSDIKLFLRNGLYSNQLNTVELRGVRLPRASYNEPVDIELDNNPFICDCTLLSFLKYMLGEIGQFLNINLITKNLFCATPESLKNLPIYSLEPKALVCRERNHCPHACNCWARTYDAVLIVDCNNANLTEVPALPTEVLSIELHIENNCLLQLPTANTPGYELVTRINASGNYISRIGVDNLPANLTSLDLSRNKFSELDINVLNHFNQSQSLKLIALADNPWKCDCRSKDLMQFVQKTKILIIDKDMVNCAGAKQLQFIKDLSLSDICQDIQVVFVTLAVCATFVGFLTTLFAALYYKYQTEFKVWMFKYHICLWCVDEEELDKNKRFDAFVSFSHKDEEFVARQLLPELENGTTTKYRLCIYVRDFIIGGYIADQIIHAIDSSKRTIVVLSRNFIESVWTRMEFRTAHQAALDEGRARVLVIVYGDIGDIDKLDPVLKAYLKMNIYLKWGDPWFWDKLRYAMPHTTKGLRK